MLVRWLQPLHKSFWKNNIVRVAIFIRWGLFCTGWSMTSTHLRSLHRRRISSAEGRFSILKIMEFSMFPQKWFALSKKCLPSNNKSELIGFLCSSIHCSIRRVSPIFKKIPILWRNSDKHTVETLQPSSPMTNSFLIPRSHLPTTNFCRKLRGSKNLTNAWLRSAIVWKKIRTFTPIKWSRINTKINRLGLNFIGRFSMSWMFWMSSISSKETSRKLFLWKIYSRTVYRNISSTWWQKWKIN